MKTMKHFIILAAILITANISMASEKSAMEAKKELCKTIQQTIKEDISEYGNYLYDRKITKLNNDVKIIFSIDQNREVKILHVKCENCDATAYIKNLFETNKVFADSILVGKAYNLNVKLKFIAK